VASRILDNVVPSSGGRCVPLAMPLIAGTYAFPRAAQPIAFHRTHFHRGR